MDLKVSFNIIDNNGNFSTIELLEKFSSEQEADAAKEAALRNFKNSGAVVISMSTTTV